MNNSPSPINTQLTTKAEIKAWLRSMHVQNDRINEDLIVDVNGDVNLSRKSLTHIPIQFGYVKGTFRCTQNKLTSLLGAPHSVGKNFYCDYNELISLKYSPKEVKGSYDCSHNKLSSLEGLLENQAVFENNFDCSFNQLTSLQYSPQEIRGSLNCEHNQIKTLVGMPQKLSQYFNCTYNQLTTLEGIPLQFNHSLDCSFNQLTSLKYCPLNLIDLYCEQNQITSLNHIGFIEERLDFSNNQVTQLPPQLANLTLIQFEAKNNQLTSLKNSPLEVQDYNVSFNPLHSLEYCPSKIHNSANFEGIDCSLEEIKNHTCLNLILSAKNNEMLKDLPLLKTRKILFFNCPELTDEILDWTINFLKFSSNKNASVFISSVSNYQTFGLSYDLSTVLFNQEKKGYSKNEIIKTYLERKSLIEKIPNSSITTPKKLKI